MLALLLSIFALVLNFGAINNPHKTPSDIAAQIQSHLPAAIGHAVAPESVPDNFPPAVGPNATSEESSESPDTARIPTYNNESGYTVGEVPQVAVNNAPPLEPCVEETCEAEPGKPEITPPPIPTPTPTSTPPVDVPGPEAIPDPITPPSTPCGPVNSGVKPPLHPLIACL